MSIAFDRISKDHGFFDILLLVAYLVSFKFGICNSVKASSLNVYMFPPLNSTLFIAHSAN